MKIQQMVFRCALKNEIGRIHAAHANEKKHKQTKTVNSNSHMLTMSFEFYGAREINETHIFLRSHCQKPKTVHMNP